MTRSFIRTPSAACACAALALLGGCSSFVPSLAPQIPTPAKFGSAAAGGAALGSSGLLGSDHWWAALREPRLDELMEAMRERNPSVEGSAASLRSAKAALGAAQAQAMPVLSANAGASRSGSDASTGIPANLANAAKQLGISGLPAGGPSNAFKAGLDANWELDLWGAQALGERSSGQQVRAAEADYDAALLSARSALAAAWVQARGAQRQILLGSQLTASLGKAAAITADKAELGAAAESDVDSAQSSAESALANFEQSKLALSQFERAIAIACGMAPSEFKMPDPPPASDAPLLAEAGAPAALLERRPDLRAAKARMLAADASRGQAEAQILPTLTLSGSGASQASTLAKLFSAGTNAWSIAPQLAATLFDGGAKRANAESAAASFDKAAAAYRQAALQALSEGEDALDQSSRTEAESRARDAAARHAQAASALSLAQYQEGVISGLQYEQVLANEIGARTSAADARTRLTLAKINVAKAFAGSIGPAP